MFKKKNGDTAKNDKEDEKHMKKSTVAHDIDLVNARHKSKFIKRQGWHMVMNDKGTMTRGKHSALSNYSKQDKELSKFKLLDDTG